MFRESPTVSEAPFVTKRFGKTVLPDTVDRRVKLPVSCSNQASAPSKVNDELLEMYVPSYFVPLNPRMPPDFCTSFAPLSTCTALSAFRPTFVSATPVPKSFVAAKEPV